MIELLRTLRQHGVTMSIGSSPEHHLSFMLVEFKKGSWRFRKVIPAVDFIEMDHMIVDILNQYLCEFLAELKKIKGKDCGHRSAFLFTDENLVSETPTPKKTRTKDKDRGVENSYANPPRFNSLDERALYYK